MTISEQTQLKEAPSGPLKSDPLYGRAMSAFTWRFVSEAVRFALQLTVIVILSHLVRVEQFGLLALAMVVINLVIGISEIGVYYAIVQRKELTETHIRVAFTLSLLFGLFFTAAVNVAAPLVATLLGNDEVTPILRLMSLMFLFMNLGSTAMGLLQRKLDYRNLLIAELCSYGLGYALVSLTLALLGYGVWALAWASVVQFFLRSVLLLWLSPHPKRPSLASKEARQLLNFGVGASLSTLANYAALNGDYFVVGRWLGAAALGLYARAYQLMTLPLMQFTAVIAYVLFPVYSMIQDDDARLRRAYLNAASLSAIIIAPALTMIGVAAPEIMSGIFGAEWVGAAAPLTILCAGGPLCAAYSLGDALARAKGAVYAKFRCHAIYAACIFAGSYIGARWGIIGVAVGVVVATIVMYLLMAQLTNRLVGASWKQYLLCQLPGAIIAASVVAVALPITVLLRAAHLPSLIILPCALIVAAVAAVVTGALLPRDWFNAVTFGARDRMMRPADKIVQFLRAYLHRRELLYKIALVPFSWYETIVFFIHVSRQGLWGALLGLRRSAPGYAGQTEMTWDVPFPPCDRASELIKWLRSQGIDVRVGGHTFYIPPQAKLARLIPEVVNFYPPGTGFKALKNFGRPTQVRYIFKDNKAYPFLHRLVRTPRDQVVVANYMYSLGIGPKIWDLTCWKGQNRFYTVFAVDHVGDKYPTTEQCLSFLERLKRLNTDTHLRVIVPDWERGEDFLPPDCHHNLRYSDTLDQPKYVDFQNFCLTRLDVWSKEAVSKANGTLRGANGVSFILNALSRASVDLSERIVLDIGCEAGRTLHAALAAGAAWGFGWDRPDVVSVAQNLLFSLGTTRFSLFAIDPCQKHRLEDDIPERFRAGLTEAVVFAHKKICAPESLRAMPWRVLIYEGDAEQPLDDAHDLLKPLLADGAHAIASFYVTAEDDPARPIIILLR